MTPIPDDELRRLVERLIEDARAIEVDGTPSQVGPDTETVLQAAAVAAELLACRETLAAASGYLLNAKIDLETGAPKKTAIQTIEGGLKVVRALLPEQKP